MLNMPAVNGEYKLPCESNGTYHELKMVPKGTINAFITVFTRHQGADVYEQLSNYLITVPTTIEVSGTLEDVKIVTTNTTGSGTIFVKLVSRDVGVQDSAIKSRAYVQSIARVFPNAVYLVTPSRPHLNTVVIQNRDNQAIYFWHGLFPADINQTTYLPLDPATWTAQQKLDAATFITTYGEKIAAGERYEPHVAQTGPHCIVM